MPEKKLILLSDGLREIIVELIKKHECPVSKELLYADDLVNAYNSAWCVYDPTAADIYRTALDPVITSIINDNARMLSFRRNTFEISFLPEGKEPVYSSEGIWSRENRQVAKPARLIQKLLIKKFTCKEFEDFSNWLKSEIVNGGTFVIVDGEDITTYYNEENYDQVNGTLGNSCMRHDECQEYFKVYEDNARMLICKNNDDLISGRAILWEIDGKIYMDRIYTSQDYLEAQFIDYAESNGWYHRQDNCLLHDGEQQLWVGPEDNYKIGQYLDLEIHLQKDYTFYPYVDSFRYLNKTKNLLTTVPDGAEYVLSSTDGYAYSVRVITCGCCGNETRIIGGNDIPDNWYWSEYEFCYLCESCAIWSDTLDDYFSTDTENVLVYHSKYSYDRVPLKYVKDYSNDFVQINDTWYDTQSSLLTYNEELNQYFLKSEVNEQEIKLSINLNEAINEVNKNIADLFIEC